MKCKYCGGEVGLEEKFCPYCGKPNEQAQLHHQNMAHYRRRFAQTEAEVVGSARKYSQIIPRIVAILLLLIAAVVMFALSQNAYFFSEEMRRLAAERHPDSIIAQLDGYLENREYLSFSSCFEYNNLRTYGTPFADYSDVEYCADNYSYFVLRLEKLFLNDKSDNWRKYSADDDIRRLCECLDDFEEAYGRSLRSEQLPLHRSAMDDMRENIRDMMRVYLGIEDEEWEAFLALSANRKAARIEEVLFGA